MKLRQPSAGNERIRIDRVRQIIKSVHETLAILDDEAARALAVAREWEGHAKAASWDTVSEPLKGEADEPDDAEPGELSYVRRDAQTSDGDPDVPPQQGDPAGEAAMNPAEQAAIYEVFVHEINELEMHSNLIAHCLGKIRKSDMDAKETARLKKANGTSGLCDACATYHDPKLPVPGHVNGNRDDRLRESGDERMYGPDCYFAWQRNLQTDNPAPRSVFERQRARRLAPEAS